MNSARTKQSAIEIQDSRTDRSFSTRTDPAPSTKTASKDQFPFIKTEEFHRREAEWRAKFRRMAKEKNAPS